MNCNTFRFDYTERKQFRFGLFSDLHLEAKTHDRKLFINDIESCINADGRVLVNGDIYEAIYRTDRKRYSRSGDTSEGDAQVNESVDKTFEVLSPYADYIDFMGMGNHEVSALKYNNVDILKLIVDRLNEIRSKALQPMARGGYVGFINLVFSRGDGATRRYVIYRDHGKGGNSPVTKGTINLNRVYTTYVADLYWFGHSHQDLTDRGGWTMSVSSQGRVLRRRKIGTITPGYNRNFDEVDLTSAAYSIDYPEENFFAPTGLGCQNLMIDLTGDDICARVV